MNDTPPVQHRRIRRTRLSDFGVAHSTSSPEMQPKVINPQESSLETSKQYLEHLADIIAADTLILSALSLPPKKMVENETTVPLASILGKREFQRDTNAEVNLASALDKERAAQIIPILPLLAQRKWYRVVLKSLQQAMKKKWVGLALRVGITFLLFAFLFKSFSWSTLAHALLHIHRASWVVGLIVGASGIVVSAYQWRSLLFGEHIRSDLADLINLYVVGIAFSHFLPTGMGGDAIKAIYIGDTSGNRAGAASATLMCRVTGFFSMILVTIPILIIWYRSINSTLLLIFTLLSLLVGAMIGGALLSVTFLPRLFKGKQVMNSRILISVTKVGRALSETIKRPRSMYASLLYGSIFSVAAVVNCYSYGQMLGINVPFYFYFVLVPFVSLISFLPISINGFGLRESAYIYAFSTVHVQPAPALLLALFMDIQALLFGIIGGCVYLAIGRKKKVGEKQRIA